MNAKIEITVDKFGNLETLSNVVELQQQREILILALKSLGSPKVYVGADLGKTKPDIRREVPGDRKGHHRFGGPLWPNAEI